MSNRVAFMLITTVVGLRLILNLMISLLTPPRGTVLYVLPKVTDVPSKACMIATGPFLAVLLLLTLGPGLCMLLPELLNLQ